MNPFTFSRLFAFIVTLCAFCDIFCPSMLTQGPSPAELKPSVEPSVLVQVTPQEAPSTHKFWDKENRALLVAVAAFSTADFAVTRANVQSGGRELEPYSARF